MILSLLSSTFNIKENVFDNKSLNSQYFKEQQLVNFKDEVSQPHKRLNAIFAKTRNAPMILSAFHAKGMVPKPVTKGNEFTVPDFIENIIKYSELISDNKKTSAGNSISSLLSKVFRKSLQGSKPKDINHRPGHASVHGLCHTTGSNVRILFSTNSYIALLHRRMTFFAKQRLFTDIIVLIKLL